MASARKPSTIISHWYHMIDDPDQSSQEFYGAIEEEIRGQALDDTKWERVNMSEGGLLAAKREYMQIRRKEHVFHVCAAPFGTGFFVSCWLGEIESGLFAELVRIPYLGPFLGFLRLMAKPYTYYRVDTALMFQSVTHGAVLEVIDRLTTAKGIRALSAEDRKPVMRDFFGKVSG